MKDFDFQTREHVGINEYLGLMSPSSPYGREELRSACPFTSVSELEHEFKNIELMINNAAVFPRIRSILSRIKNIDRSLMQASGRILEHPELFEIRKLLFLLEELAPIVNSIGLYGINIPSFHEAISVLDPEGTRSPGYYIGGPKWPKLEEMRRNKAAASNEEERLRFWQLEDAEEENARREITDAIGPYCDDMLRTAHMAGHIDLICEKASLAINHNCCRPHIGKNISMKAMRNFRYACQKGSFTPLDIELRPGCTVITGANMGGKSVALSTLAMHCWLCQSGFYPPAENAVFVMLDGFHMLWDRGTSSIGLSSFAGEMTELNEILSVCSEGIHLILADELARGTNPSEGAKIASGTVTYLNCTPSYSVITTHYDNVASRSVMHYRASSIRHDADSCKDISELFTYGLSVCPPDESCPRDALAICKLLGMNSKLMKHISDNYN